MKTLDLSKQLDDVELREEIYNMFLENCLKSRTNTTWIYWLHKSDGYIDSTKSNYSVRRKVYYDKEKQILIANARPNNHWCFIVKKIDL